jgi:phosphate transport system protein
MLTGRTSRTDMGFSPASAPPMIGWLPTEFDREDADGPAPVFESSFDNEVAGLFSMVNEALTGATDALLSGDPERAARVVVGDGSFEELSEQLSELISQRIELLGPDSQQLRRLVALLLILSELERSADLAERIVQRAVARLGPSMSPESRDIVRRMARLALEMWHGASEAYACRAPVFRRLDQADRKLESLCERLADEAAYSEMPVPVAAQVTLLGEFYARLGAHAINLALGIELLPKAEMKS